MCNTNPIGHATSHPASLMWSTAQSEPAPFTMLLACLCGHGHGPKPLLQGYVLFMAMPLFESSMNPLSIELTRTLDRAVFITVSQV